MHVCVFSFSFSLFLFGKIMGQYFLWLRFMLLSLFFFFFFSFLAYTLFKNLKNMGTNLNNLYALHWSFKAIKIISFESNLIAIFFLSLSISQYPSPALTLSISLSLSFPLSYFAFMCALMFELIYKPPKWQNVLQILINILLGA